MGEPTPKDETAHNTTPSVNSQQPSHPGATQAGGPAAPTATPAKPAAAGKKEKEAMLEPRKLRRRFIWSCIWGYLTVNFLMFLRFFFPRTLFEPNPIVNIGFPADFQLGVDTKFQKDYRIWVVRDPDRLFVLFARCTHLGCTPDWKPAENKFKCPCHGSGYDSDGINFEGPAPRPLDRCKLQVSPTGEIIVDTSKLFQCPKTGRCQFDDQGAFLVV